MKLNQNDIDTYRIIADSALLRSEGFVKVPPKVLKGLLEAREEQLNFERAFDELWERPEDTDEG